MIEDNCQILINEIEYAKKLAEKELTPIKKTVDWILEIKFCNYKYIEKTLNSLLLNLVPFQVGVYEFHKLNNFYLTFNAKKAREYIDIYEKVSMKVY